MVKCKYGPSELPSVEVNPPTPFFGELIYLSYMKVIIGENRIFGIMDSILKLSYNPETREFYSGGAIDGVIGYKYKDGFTYGI